MRFTALPAFDSFWGVTIFHPIQIGVNDLPSSIHNRLPPTTAFSRFNKQIRSTGTPECFSHVDRPSLLLVRWKFCKTDPCHVNRTGHSIADVLDYSDRERTWSRIEFFMVRRPHSQISAPPFRVVAFDGVVFFVPTLFTDSIVFTHVDLPSLLEPSAGDVLKPNDRHHRIAWTVHVMAEHIDESLRTESVEPFSIDRTLSDLAKELATNRRHSDNGDPLRFLAFLETHRLVDEAQQLSGLYMQPLQTPSLGFRPVADLTFGQAA